MGVFNDWFRDDRYVHENDRQWFGKKKPTTLPGLHMEFLMEQGLGAWQWDGGVPEECLAFVADQLVRNGLEVTPGIMLVLEASAEEAFNYINFQDPYVLFSRGLSDVTLTDDWAHFTYEVTKYAGDGKSMRFEPSAESVESYELSIPQSEWAFRQFMETPWMAYVEALQGEGVGRGMHGPDGDYHQEWATPPHPLNDIARSLKDMIEERALNSGSDWASNEEREALLNLRHLCTYRATGGHNVVDIRRVEFYQELAAWAAFVWVIGPLGREFRIHCNQLTEAVHEEGEAILADCWVVGKAHFRKLQRPTEACVRCHIQAWCLEISVQDNCTARICESCMSRDMPILPPANCGTRLCKMPQCKHHPYYAFDPNLRLHQTMRSVGQLSKPAEEAKRLAGQAGGRNLLP